MQVASKSVLWTESFPKNATVLVVRIGPYGMTAKICAGSLAQGSESVTVDWGDGTKESFPNLSNRMHTYRREKDYTIKISDDIQSFGFTAGNPGGDHFRNMLLELVCVGSKVTRLEGYGFNNCHNMRGVINLPNVTSIGGYCFGTTLGITDYFLPSMTTLVQESFYAGSSPARMYVDNVTHIPSRFFDYYGPHMTDMFIRNKTCSAIKAMSGFPFCANSNVRFHGSDGIVMANGTIIS